MGLIGALLALPLAPARGVIWIVERLEQVAEQEMHDPTAAQKALQEAEREHAAGRMTDKEFESIETALLNGLLGLSDPEQRQIHPLLNEEEE
jgi:hypothetical protein